MAKNIYIIILFAVISHFAHVEGKKSGPISESEAMRILEFTRNEAKSFTKFTANRLISIAESIYALVDNADLFFRSID